VKLPFSSNIEELGITQQLSSSPQNMVTFCLYLMIEKEKFESTATVFINASFLKIFSCPYLTVQSDSSFTARTKTPTSNPFKILKKCRNN
jgi:hypothetical protein